MDKTFICFRIDANELFLNLYQIVSVSVEGDALDLSMGDGRLYRVTGEEGIGKLLAILAEHAMTLDGQPLLQVAPQQRVRDSGLKFTRREDEP